MCVCIVVVSAHADRTLRQSDGCQVHGRTQQSGDRQPRPHAEDIRSTHQGMWVYDIILFMYMHTHRELVVRRLVNEVNNNILYEIVHIIIYYYNVGTGFV